MSKGQKITLGIGLVIVLGYLLHPPGSWVEINVAALFFNIMVLAIIIGGIFYILELLKKYKKNEGG